MEREELVGIWFVFIIGGLKRVTAVLFLCVWGADKYLARP